MPDGRTSGTAARPALTPTPKATIYLQNLGKEARYEGGGPLADTCYVMQKCDERVAKSLFGRGHGVIGTRVTMYSMVHGLGFDNPKYQSSAVISSVVHRRYLKYMDEVGAWFRFEADRGLTLRAFTAHALPCKLPLHADVDRVREAFSRSRTLFSLAAKSLHLDGWTDQGFEIILVREEHAVGRGKEDPIFKDFVHNHGLYTAKRGSPKYKEFMAAFRAEWQLAHAKLRDEFPDLFEPATPFEPYLWHDRVKGVEDVVGYMAKPCEVPMDLHDDGIEWLHLVTRRRRQFQAYGSFAEWRRELTETGDRIECIDGYYRRITRRRTVDDDYAVLDDDDDDELEDESLAEAAQEAVQGEPVVSADKVVKSSSKQPTNVLCGPTTPRAGPDNRKESFFIVANASDSFLEERSKLERSARLYEWREEAQRLWSEATGEAFSTREYLRPRAAKLWAWAHHQDPAYRAQLRISNVILGICRDILIEEGKLPPESAPEPEWHGPQKRALQLTADDPPPF